MRENPNNDPVKSALNDLISESKLSEILHNQQSSMVEGERYFLEGIKLAQKNKQESAVESFSKSIACYDRASGPFLNRGVMYHQLGMYEKAAKDYEKAVELETADNTGSLDVAKHNLSLVYELINGQDDDFTSLFEPTPELQSEEGVQTYMLKLSRFNHSKICIEFSNVMSAKYNLMSVPTGLNDFQKVQALVTDLTDKALAICMLSFGQNAIFSYCGGDSRIFNELISETDKIVASLDLEPEHHGEQLLNRLRKHLNL